LLPKETEILPRNSENLAKTSDFIRYRGYNFKKLGF